MKGGIVMSSVPYGIKRLDYPTRAIVIEDNYWYYGKPKTKAKISIPAIMTLQERPEPISFIEKKSNSRIKDKTVDKTLNYIEMYVPDNCYTYPSETKAKNDHQTLHGATEDYIPEGHTKPLDNGTNGEKKLKMVRVLPKNTRLMIVFIDGEARIENIKIIGKYDDAMEITDQALSVNKLGNTGGISSLTIQSAIRGSRSH
jgi:hypothetical protein